jgi:UDP-N-acetylglucosamine/UDP-N-acetylgalactosamine 4-epimerase
VNMAHHLRNKKILITGGAGFIGSNLVGYFLEADNEVVCLDNLSTGYIENVQEFFNNPNFQMREGDIRNLDTCKAAVEDCDYVFHHAALGSVPRSIIDPVTTNSVNIDGFLNMLTAARDAGVKRFIYAASSSTYGNSKDIPKIEERVGRPLSPYAITKAVNEHFAQVYSELYGLETIGLRYFNIFGKHQDPNGEYSAVIPIWVKALIEHQSPIINGDGSFSRDFTYINNVLQANDLAASTSKNLLLNNLEKYYFNLEKKEGILAETPTVVMEIFNVAFGGNTTLFDLFNALKSNLSEYDADIAKIEVSFGSKRAGDVPHSLASVEKAKSVLGYDPQFSAQQGFQAACAWYYENMK